MLEIKNVTKKYNDYVANKNINIKINDGVLFGFIGPNGAGKTTLIKSIVGIHEFDEGTITIDGYEITKNPVEAKKKLAYISDNPDLYNSILGIDYLNMMADIYDVSESDRKEIIEKYGKLFGIYDELNNFIKTYSHGMKQKLAIIGALVHSPKLLVLDEPFVGLDPITTKQVKDILKSLCDEGVIVFFSSHVLEIVEKLCDEIAIIKKGEIIVQGKTTDVTSNKDLEDVFMELIDDGNV